MKTISGNIYNPLTRSFIKGRLFYNDKIVTLFPDPNTVSKLYILPGLIDAHVHIESSMLSPVEYARESIRHGVVAAVTDPHEIANVCGLDGIRYMIESAKLSPMKIFTGAPSCVPATNMERSGASIDASQIEQLFSSGDCSHLAEMMNFPGVIFDDPSVNEKIEVAKKYNLPIDGHAPMLSGEQLTKYFSAGITTDHECTTLQESLEKISLGMKIMLRESSASKDFDILDQLIEKKPDSIMFCTDDCHPDDLQDGYIEKLFRKALHKNYPIQNIISAATINAIEHFKLNVGYLRQGDSADFIVVDNLKNFTIQKTIIGGVTVFSSNNFVDSIQQLAPINNFYSNEISADDIKIKNQPGKSLHVIEVVPDSLLTKRITISDFTKFEFIEPDTRNDILKIVVVNRYEKAKPAVGFIKGIGIKTGAIGGSVAHDSHNIIVIGADDVSILKAIAVIQKGRGGLVAITGSEDYFLPLPIAGLMSDKSCSEVALEYKTITTLAQGMGSTLKSPYMTMAFMALLVIPELKIGDQGLFDVNTFSLIDLQS